MMKVYRKNSEGIIHYNLDSSENISQVTSAQQSTSLLSEDTVSLTVTSTKPIDFQIHDYIEVFDKYYFLNSLPSLTKEGIHKFTYNLVFESQQYDLLNVTFLITETTTGVDLQGDYLMADLKRFAEVLIM